MWSCLTKNSGSYFQATGNKAILHSHSQTFPDIPSGSLAKTRSIWVPAVAEVRESHVDFADSTQSERAERLDHWSLGALQLVLADNIWQ